MPKSININLEIEKAKKKAESLNLPFKDLTGEKIPVEVLKEIPEEAATFYRFVPIKKEGNVLEVGMVDPEDLKAREALRFIALRSKLKPKIFVITPSHLKEVLRQYRTLREEIKRALTELEKEFKEEKEKVKPEEIVARIAQEAPITKIVAVILKHAVEGRASDIHIEPMEKQLRVRFRVDGVLHTSLILPLHILEAIVSRIKILANLRIDETRVPQDGRFQTTIEGRKIDLRVSTLPTSKGEKVALRVLDPLIGLKDLPELGLQGRNLSLIQESIKKPYGMILITGPTGSGKTTTLYAIMDILNKEGVNIISLEDPIEYRIEGINQSQIRPEIGYTFASGLRSILRQDPDIIMVGEIRDEETAGLAVHAALTGHIVLSTLHTNNAIGVIPRLIDMGVRPFLIPSTLNLAIAQRLVKRLCVHCRKEIVAPPQISKIIQKELGKLDQEQLKKLKIDPNPPYKIYRASGCKFCAYKGTKGRVALFEMLAMTSELEKIIISSPTEANLEKEAARQGMITMKQDGIIKVLQGIVSFEEVMKVVEE